MIASGFVLDTNLGFVPSRDPASIDVDALVKGLWTGDGPDRLSRTVIGEWQADGNRTAVDVLQSYFR